MLETNNNTNKSSRFIERKTLLYEFDKTGNWQKKIKFKNDEPVQIILREIIYSK